jgi:hypothetical protein
MRILLFALLTLLVVACSKKDHPKDVLSPEQMEAVMWDLFRADEMVNVEEEKDTSFNRNARSNQLYNEIFRIHKTTRQQFKTSMQFYEMRPDLFQPVLDSLKVLSEKVTIVPKATTDTISKDKVPFKGRNVKQPKLD